MNKGRDEKRDSWRLLSKLYLYVYIWFSRSLDPSGAHTYTLCPSVIEIIFIFARFPGGLRDVGNYINAQCFDNTRWRSSVPFDRSPILVLRENFKPGTKIPSGPGGEGVSEGSINRDQ